MNQDEYLRVDIYIAVIADLGKQYECNDCKFG